MTRGHKHGFLDFNQPTPIPKDVINARRPTNAIIRTVGEADATRPIVPVPTASAGWSC